MKQIFSSLHRNTFITELFTTVFLLTELQLTSAGSDGVLSFLRTNVDSIAVICLSLLVKTE